MWMAFRESLLIVTAALVWCGVVVHWLTPADDAPLRSETDTVYVQLSVGTSSEDPERVLVEARASDPRFWQLHPSTRRRLEIVPIREDGSPLAEPISGVVSLDRATLMLTTDVALAPQQLYEARLILTAVANQPTAGHGSTTEPTARGPRMIRLRYQPGSQAAERPTLTSMHDGPRWVATSPLQARPLLDSFGHTKAADCACSICLATTSVR